MNKPTSDDFNHPSEVGGTSSAERGRLGWRQNLRTVVTIGNNQCKDNKSYMGPGLVKLTEETAISLYSAVLLAQVRAHL